MTIGIIDNTFADGVLTDLNVALREANQKCELLQSSNDKMREAIWQALDDMGESGHCVCPAAKELLKQAVGPVMQKRTDPHCQICGMTDKEYTTSGSSCADPWHKTCEIEKLRRSLIDTQSLLTAMLLEPRPTEEIEAQILSNRAVLGDCI